MAHYLVAINVNGERRGAESNDGGKTFGIVGDSGIWKRSDFAEVTKLDVSVARYCNNVDQVQIGDEVATICGDYTGRVESILRPHGMYERGCVVISGKLFSAASVYKI